MDTQLCNGFQTTHMFYLSRNFGNCVEQNKTNIILSFTNASLIQIESSVNWERVQIQKSPIAFYNVFMLSPLANRKRDILLTLL